MRNIFVKIFVLRRCPVSCLTMNVHCRRLGVRGYQGIPWMILMTPLISITRIWGAFWPKILLLGITSQFLMLVKFLSVYLSVTITRDRQTLWMTFWISFLHLNDILNVILTLWMTFWMIFWHFEWYLNAFWHSEWYFDNQCDILGETLNVKINIYTERIAHDWSIGVRWYCQEGVWIIVFHIHQTTLLTSNHVSCHLIHFLSLPLGSQYHHCLHPRRLQEVHSSTEGSCEIM